jgi:RimJ/RimL family protein N-acetyltransferase
LAQPVGGDIRTERLLLRRWRERDREPFAAINARSRRVMKRLGMTHDPAEDFPHPGIAAGDRLRPHVLYRLAASSWHGPTSDRSHARGATSEG